MGCCLTDPFSDDLAGMINDDSTVYIDFVGIAAVPSDRCAWRCVKFTSF